MEDIRTTGQPIDRKTGTEKGVRLGIKVKLLGILLPVVIIVLAVIILLVNTNMSNMMLKNNEELLATSTQSIINDIRAWMNKTITALETERDAVQYFDMNEAEELDYIKHTANKHEAYPAGLYLATTDGKLMHASFVPGPEYNVFEKSWYIDGLKSENFMFGAVYFDEDSQAYVVGASGVLKDKAGTVRGVAAADIYLNAISEIVGQVQLEQTGGMLLVDTITDTIIGHKDSSYLGTLLSDREEEMYQHINSQIHAGTEGLITFEDSAKERFYMDIEKIPDSSWVSVCYVPYNEILEELHVFTRNIIFMAVVGLLVLVLLMERFIHMIVKPVKKLSGSIAAMTEGDFSIDVNVKTKDEIGIMADGVHKFIHTMRNTISQITQISKILNEQSMESAGISADLSKSADVQATSMSDMNRTVQELALSISEVAESASRLSGLVAGTTQSGEAAETQMKEAVTASAAGRQDMSQVMGYMQDVSVKMGSLETSAEQMDESISKINSIVDLISDIAEETNLLSLNASIEAARAGEAGRGFAVVADQIGKLATTSKKAVEDIADLTGAIKELVTKTVEETRDSADTIRSSQTAVNQAGTTFEQIYGAVGETNQAVTGMITMVKEVNNIALTVAGITQEQSAASEEILATTETIRENAESVDHDSQVMSSDAKSLEESARKLSEQMSMFKL